ncbi:MAG: 50S ribosomal protein L11 [Candidatus Pacebacteria bacterium CG_4_10_14_0_8_um_filter_43_12]|nr:MAG: 50S ribosomal protein L11 [Candidatus Pacebacteria bacterium CG10_big_fil_rev_8_21_14_0_10_44_11]PIY79789.1 MAG: 50S ribosomal protein L11 [Candidatus Pacebacteria bacterium CG_4_10_14_0_8_um_filter_43_12]
MAKQVKNVLKLNLSAGTATPAPPVGPILGQAGINMMDFLRQYNEKTKDQKGQIIPAELTIYKDNSFTFILKLPPVSAMILQTLKLKAGGATPSRESAGVLTMDQVKAIAEKKMPDLNTESLASAIHSVIGSARSMGIQVK